MSTNIEKQLVDLYLANLELLEEGLPSYVNRMRSGAIEAFRLNGLPDRKVEKYKYTDIRTLYEGREYEKYFAPLPDTAGCRGLERLPLDAYETLPALEASAREALRGLASQVRPTGHVTADMIEEDYRAHTRAIEYMVLKPQMHS